MRCGLAFGFAIVVTILLGFGESEAACRASGEYRVTGPNVAGNLALTETATDDSTSSGTFALSLVPKRGCPVCLVAVQTWTGEYHALPVFDGGCSVGLAVRNLGGDLVGGVGGRVTSGGAVIMFESFGFNGPAPPYVDLNLTLGIRADAFRP